MELRVNDLFCGAGGMGLGFKNAGFRLAGAWDFDKYAVESYGNNVSPKVKQADITQMKWDEIPYADVWTFGFPCQDISLVGKRAGMVKGQTRSGLFYEVMRILEETEQNQPEQLPKVILAENVKGVKKYLEEIEKEYKERGYVMYYTLYNSKYWGIPQHRERYFIVGVHESVNKKFDFPKQQTDYIPKLSDFLEEYTDDKYNLKKTKDFFIKNSFDQEEKGNGFRFRPHIKKNAKVATTLTTRAGGRMDDNFIIDINSEEDRLEFSSKNKELSELDISQTPIRRLTPRECARLQGFPDTYKQVVSDTQFYKQMGNAVTVNVSEAIAETIKEFLTN